MQFCFTIEYNKLISTRRITAKKLHFTTWDQITMVLQMSVKKTKMKSTEEQIVSHGLTMTSVMLLLAKSFFLPHILWTDCRRHVLVVLHCRSIFVNIFNSVHNNKGSSLAPHAPILRKTVFILNFMISWNFVKIFFLIENLLPFKGILLLRREVLWCYSRICFRKSKYLVWLKSSEKTTWIKTMLESLLMKSSQLMVALHMS